MNDDAPGNRIPFHPAAAIFPLMPEGKLKKLGARIKALGQLSPIQTLDGMILIGRNRYLACLMADIQPWIEPLPESFDGDPEELVVDSNRFRQHWDEKQLAMIAAKLVTTTRGGDRSIPIPEMADQTANWRFGGKPKERTVAQAAACIRVSIRAVERARNILKANDPGLTLLVEAGTPWLSLGGAEALARLPEQKRQTVLDEDSYRHAMRAIRDEQAGRTPPPPLPRPDRLITADAVRKLTSDQAVVIADEALAKIGDSGWDFLIAKHRAAIERALARTRRDRA
jgi:hypothetical protein